MKTRQITCLPRIDIGMLYTYDYLPLTTQTI